ncbi:M15 family metallopeptidase [Moraxella catarrhalis]|uniref:M15 family metallopeptidase n=1 Tax=Moraxella catarrhalis TaxID=480 RepID=UPI0007E45D75|nr:M15 family metallopeptidase [Moraxella catarrhalis]
MSNLDPTLKTISERSLKSLQGVHPDLVKVVLHAIKISPVDFSVMEGVRTKEHQRELVKKRASKTMNSRHLTGHAVDIVPIIGGKISWNLMIYPLPKQWHNLR